MIRKQSMQQLEDLQPKRHIDVDTKILTRNYFNMIYESVPEKERTKEFGDLLKKWTEMKEPKRKNEKH